MPTGVVIGALSATLVRRHDSITLSGIGVPSLAMTSTPASCSSQLIATPVASMHILVGLRQLRSDTVAEDQRHFVRHRSAISLGRRCAHFRTGLASPKSGMGHLVANKCETGILKSQANLPRGRPSSRAELRRRERALDRSRGVLFP